MILVSERMMEAWCGNEKDAPYTLSGISRCAPGGGAPPPEITAFATRRNGCDDDSLTVVVSHDRRRMQPGWRFHRFCATRINSTTMRSHVQIIDETRDDDLVLQITLEVHTSVATAIQANADAVFMGEAVVPGARPFVVSISETDEHHIAGYVSYAAHSIDI